MLNPSSVYVMKNRPSGSSTAEEIYNCQTIWEFPVITREGDLEGEERERENENLRKTERDGQTDRERRETDSVRD